MAIHGKERTKLIHALEHELEYKGGSALTITKHFRGWGRYFTNTSEHPPAGIRTWVYSYDTPIAWVTNGNKVVIPDCTYSNTTTHHQGLCMVYLGRQRCMVYDPDKWQKSLD